MGKKTQNGSCVLGLDVENQQELLESIHPHSDTYSATIENREQSSTKGQTERPPPVSQQSIELWAGGNRRRYRLPANVTSCTEFPRPQ